MTSSKPQNQEVRNPRGIVHPSISTHPGPIQTKLKRKNSNKAPSSSSSNKKILTDPSIPRNVIFPFDTMNFDNRKEDEVRICTWNVRGIKSADKKV